MKRLQHQRIQNGITLSLLTFSLIAIATTGVATAFAQKEPKRNAAVPKPKLVDAKNKPTGKPAPIEPEEYRNYGIYAKTALRAPLGKARKTTLPLKLEPKNRIVFIGNGLLERSQYSAYLETFIQQHYPEHQLSIRNLAWSADTPDIQPRPDNFADQDQHLTHEKADVIFASFGFNESFAGKEGIEAFRKSLSKHVLNLRSRQYNGKTTPQVVLVSPIASENLPNVPAGNQNNENLRLYANVVHDVAKEQEVAYIDLYTPTLLAMEASETPLTINGVHLNDAGYELFAREMFRSLFNENASAINEDIRQTAMNKNRQFFRRYRPANTFYYTGGRNKTYGYLDFLPAMKNFEIMVANRDQRIWDIAQGKAVPEEIDDSNLPVLPDTKESRGANAWMSAEDELKAFEIDPRFEVNLFAGEEEFPEIAAPIQMRWDSRGRLWVSCSTTYPHVYPGNEPNDQIVILEDTDGDGRADKSTVFADNLHIPLSFVLGDGGVYVSEMPDLTFLRDTDGDDVADERISLLSGFGTEDSHHSLHDFTWTPDGQLLFRESIFHHSQVETAYGPVRQQNSGWFRFEPRTHRLTSFGTYHSTNPWGVTFDDWGNHVASHPIFAAAHHSLDPTYPTQHPKPTGLQAYSGTCGHEFVDFNTFPDELRGHMIKVRYKPTNRVEILQWNETEFGFEEKYVSDLIFSKNLSFIPVDLQYGPRGALYICDWYNPVKGHAQYSLRDERRDRHSGRIWRITAKGKPLQDPPKIHGASISELLELLKRPEYRIRSWAKRELRERDAAKVKQELDQWVTALDPNDKRHRHHQMEAVWAYRTVQAANPGLLRELLRCEDHHARAAAVHQLRYWHTEMKDAIELLHLAANDAKGLVRMEAAIAATYIGTKPAFECLVETLNHPANKHTAYAIRSALGSHTMIRHWKDNPEYRIEALMKKLERSSQLKEPTPTAKEAEFDTRKDLKTVRISCLPERMRYTVSQFAVQTGQSVKLVFTNPDATDHNLVFVKPGTLADVGMAANEMAKDPKNANSDFIPKSHRSSILHASPMIGPTRKTQVHVLRFEAPKEPGIYPFVCTFPGHWVIMRGEMVVAKDLKDVEAMLAARVPQHVQEWKLEDFAKAQVKDDEETIMRGLQAFAKARCNQCHMMSGHGVNLGPDLTKIGERFKGQKLFEQIVTPSAEINKKYQNYQFLLKNGKIVTGVIQSENANVYQVAPSLLTPKVLVRVPKRQVEEKIASQISPMPNGLVNTLEKQEIIDLVSFLQAGGYHPPKHLEKEVEKKD